MIFCYIRLVSWYKNFCTNFGPKCDEKIFRIYIIHDNDWVNPVFSYSVDNEDDLAEALSDCKVMRRR